MNRCAIAAWSLALGLALWNPRAIVAAETPAAGWQSLGTMPAPHWDGKTLLFQSDQGALAVIPVSDDVIRVRFTPAKNFGRDHSYAVIAQEGGAGTAKVETSGNVTTLTTASLRVTIQHAPLRISFATAAGEILDAEDSHGGISFAGNGRIQASEQLRDDEHVYGLGEKNGHLDKRGWQLGGNEYVMWNSDTYSYDSSTDPIYVSVPFCLVTRNGQAHGIFLDNTWRSFFDIGHRTPGLLTFGAEGGDLNYYFINGPSPKDVVERYTALTGRMPLPPLWSLGYNQCRYSYYPESRVRLLADTFRDKKVPADVIWLDIHYQDNYKPFTWNHERFPNPKKMISDLRAQHFHVVTIVDAHPKAEKGYAPYDEGMAGNYFAKNPDGSVFEGPVWPAQADENPGPSVFPDFTKPGARAWWGSLFKGFMDDGVSGIWNDMNEPALFNTPTGTLPLDVMFDNEGQPTSQREVHNVFGQLMSRATYEGLAQLRPNERPFVLTRASFAGGQRYAAVWTGDSQTDWASLRQSVSMLLGLGVSGFPFVGSDISGFTGPATPELYARWLQAGAFFPFMRSHTTFGTPDKEPWAFGWQYEEVNRKTIELRYELLPYIYNMMQQASETGLPAMRPLFLEFPEDRSVTGMDDEFLFGSDLLVAPVLVEDATARDVYLPQGEWFDYWTGKQYTGGKSIHLPVTINSIPMFVRGGGFIFRQPVVQSTDEMPGKPLRVLVAPATDSKAALYEDDGETPGYRKGDFMTRQFHQMRNDGKITVDVSAPEGTFRPAARDLIVETWSERAPKNVSAKIGDAAASALPRLDADAFDKSERGWTFSDGLLRARTKDAFSGTQFTVER
ncbi:MAG TPA: glycoside hydrolase family 31 protein [Verrucomicrobiae bacterium]|nr:glycoside hydrolase family 31 protein [Verrucomicrobiae bacterium]